MQSTNVLSPMSVVYLWLIVPPFAVRCRLAMPFTVVVLSQIASGSVAAPLAAGLMSLDGTAGLHGW